MQHQKVIKDDGVVLVLQNGLGIEEQVAQIVGHKRVIGGLCFICSNKVEPGRIRHFNYIGNYSFANLLLIIILAALPNECGNTPMILNLLVFPFNWRKT